MRQRDRAIDYARRGWAVFPVRPDKTPMIRDWPNRATVDVERVSRWWSRHPDDAIGIATGPSDLVGVDCDVKRLEDGTWVSGIEELALLQADNGRFGPTWTVDTPSGGRHYYFEAPPDVDLRNSAGKLAQGVDVRAQGGYLVAGGSTTTAGQYSIRDNSPPVVLPDWIVQALKSPSPAESPSMQELETATHSLDKYVAAALRGETERIRRAQAGTRNHTLFRASANLGQLVGAGALDEALAVEALTQAYAPHVAAGADRRPGESQATIESGIRSGRQAPRRIHTRRPTPAKRSPTMRPRRTRQPNSGMSR